MKRKFLSAAMALLMACSMAVPAFAEDTSITDLAAPTSFEYTGSVALGTVKVTMATAGQVFVNPYNVAIKIGETGSGASKTDVTSEAKVVSATSFIKNESDTGLKVGVTVVGNTAKTIELVTKESDMASKTNKAALLKFQIQKADDDTDLLEENSDWTSAFNQIAADSKTAVAVDTGVLMAKPASAGAATYAAFRVTGDVVSNPMSTKDPTKTDPWSADDTVNVSVAFTFTPNNDATLTLAATDTTLDDTTTTSTTVTATGGPATGTPTYTWTSSDATVATVSGTGASGTVTYVGAGSVTITCSTKDENGKSYSGSTTITCT